MAAKKRARESAPPPKSIGQTKRIVDLAAELQDMRTEMDALHASLRVGAQELREHADALDKTLDEVRAGALDRDKLVAIASRVVAIARALADRSRIAPD